MLVADGDVSATYTDRRTPHRVSVGNDSGLVILDWVIIIRLDYGQGRRVPVKL